MPEFFLAAALLLQAPPAQDPKSEITEKEAIEFASRMEKFLLDGLYEKFDELFDMKGIVEDAIRGLPLAKDDADAFRTRSIEGFAFGKKLASGSGDSYRFLRILPSSVPPQPVFRLMTQSGINYHQYRLKKTPEGQIRIADLLNHMAGYWWTPVWRRYALALLALDPGLKEKVPKQDVDFANHIEKIREMEQAANEGRSARALAIYGELPLSVKRDRIVQITRVKAAIKGSTDDYVAAEEEFNRFFPDDLSKDLIGLDA
ncbi:MAG TPA: hypothetical protein VFS19_06340, partial [Planctomycetota bacterium]|nr:hypothetical protein [Planctomycetota bacterium]